MYIFKQGIWANQIHLQSYETLIFNDTATIRLQVYTFGVESFTDGWIPEKCNLIDGWLRIGLPPPPREFCRHILSCRELKAKSFKKCLHSVRWGVSL